MVFLKRTALSVATAAALGLSTAVAIPLFAHAEETHSVDSSSVLDRETEEQYRDILKRKGVTDSSLQEALLNKLRQGEILDADNPDIAPVSSEETREDNRVVTRSVFPDGSVGTTIIGADPKTIRAYYGISQCKKYNHGDWTRHDNCRVAYDGISFAYSFIADYSTRRKNNVNATIRNAHSPAIHRAIGHSTSSPTVSITRSWQNGLITPAEARMSFEATPFKVFWTTTLSLRLQVAGSQAVVVP